MYCRSYGSVYKALHKDSGEVLAIKQVPVDTDLQEIIKEISIMQQCDSPYIVKYYGSYFKNTDLWVTRVSKSLGNHRRTGRGVRRAVDPPKFGLIRNLFEQKTTHLFD